MCKNISEAADYLKYLKFLAIKGTWLGLSRHEIQW